jgi:hypothetical protein
LGRDGSLVEREGHDDFLLDFLVGDNVNSHGCAVASCVCLFLIDDKCCLRLFSFFDDFVSRVDFEVGRR